jgi:serine/threonine-protein kinase
MNLVELALACPIDERETYLRSACGHHAALFRLTWSYVQWDQRMNGFLLDPLYPPPCHEHPFEPGEVLDERFRIVREVAQGGMGIVYEALDEKLERRIALKCAKVGFRKRLPPEVRNATEIAHLNVCKTFEIHTASTRQGTIDFLTMEFLEGETLAERLRRGPLPEKEARTIARQLCDGLAAAHRKQVIHGDLKSNNVILTTGADGTIRAVITDFGLASGPEATQRTLQSGELGGTPDYMAPELWRGEKASVASDVYALGVILYELACGHRPQWPGVTWEERLTWKPPPVRPKWDRVLARCLDPDPGKRFHTADDVAQAFAPSVRRRWLLEAAAAAVLVVVSGVVIHRIMTVPGQSVVLAMLPFESGHDTATVAESVFHETERQLSHLQGNTLTKLTFVPASKTQGRHVDTTEKARSLLGATHVLRGSLERKKEKVVIHAYLADLRTRVNAKQWKAEYTPAELRYAPVALAGVVTETLRLPPLAGAATVNAAAKQDYWNGLYYLRRNFTVDTALALLERAVAADPDSPLTYAALAEAQQLKFFLTSADAWLERAKESAWQAERRNPDLAQVHRVAGVLKYREGLYEPAAAECLRAIELDPNNGEAYRRLGQAYEASNKLDEALAEYRRSVEMDPGDFRNHQQLGTFYYQRADYNSALEHFVRTVELAPEEPRTHFALGQGYQVLGRLDEAESELRLSLRSGETGHGLHTLGVILMEEHKYEEAAACILRAVHLGPERLVWWMNLGTVYRLMNLKHESENAYRRALELGETEIARDPRNGKTRSRLAFVCARLGEQKRAESDIAQSLQMSPNDADVHFMAAATYEAMNRREDTLKVLSALPYAELADVRRWPDMADLLQDSRFLQLMDSRQIK